MTETNTFLQDIKFSLSPTGQNNSRNMSFIRLNKEKLGSSKPQAHIFGSLLSCP